MSLGGVQDMCSDWGLLKHFLSRSLTITLLSPLLILFSSETFVPHTIDRGYLQFAPIQVGSDCSIGVSCCLLPSSTLEDGSSMGPVSLALKGEVLQRDGYGQGVPMVTLDSKLPTDYVEHSSAACACSNCCAGFCCCSWCLSTCAFRKANVYAEEETSHLVPKE